MKLKLIILFFCLITHLTNFAQTNNPGTANIGLPADRFVQPVAYIIHGNDCIASVKSIQLSTRNHALSCKISFTHTEESEYWNCKVGNIHRENNRITTSISDISFEGTDNTIYLDNNATGSIIFQEDNGIETMNIDFHIHNQKQNYVIRWKAFEPLEGKKFEGMIRESCVKTIDGGNVIYTYCLLSFGKDSVTISEYSSKNHNTTDNRTGKSYPYSMTDNRITIPDFNRYGILEWNDSQITGKEEWGNGQSKQIIFKETEY